MSLLVQVEITTRCNFGCFYCAGRHMRQGDMPYEAFLRLLEQHIVDYGVPNVVSLQGEGEPTLHHEFLRMAELVRSKGARPYTITNGTYKHPEQLIGLFPEIGVSVDTLDETAGEKIGRYNLPRVLRFIDMLAPHARIVIHSVKYEEHTPRIAAWCRQRGFRHVVQPLQVKPDYSRHYRSEVAVAKPVGRFSCDYLSRPKMRYYNLDGVEMPCCFIKDTVPYQGIADMLRHQEQGSWPKVCIGCGHARDGTVRMIQISSRQ